jgi:hypothetical protein
MQVGVASGWRWLRRGSARHPGYEVTPARFVPAGGQIQWAGLLLVATASVALFGAVELRFLAPIELSLFCLAGLALIRRVRRGLPILNLHRAATPLLAILGLAVVQLVPLPTSLTYALSPGMAAVREGVPQGPAATLALSVYPYVTQLAVLRLAAYTVFFLLALDSISSPARVRTALVWAAGLGTVVALYGLFSYLTANTRLLWLPRRFYLDCVTGTFVNRNNFATLMVLLLPALLACYWTRPPARNPESDRGDAIARAGFFVLCGAAMGLALLFSRSRGGIVCGMLSLGALTLGLRRYGGQPGRALAILPIVLGGAVAAWAAYGSYCAFRRSKPKSRCSARLCPL